jgi:hypothetical protein
MVRKLFSIILLNLLINEIKTKEKSIVSFNVYESESSFGDYFANLEIPSLHIKAETNLTLNTDNSQTNCIISAKVQEPFGFDLFGELNASIDTSFMAKLFDISLRSNTYSHLNAKSRTRVMRDPKSDDLIVLTNLTFNDSFNQMSANYNLTFISAKTCPTISLYHNLTTIPDSILYFSSNVTEVCDFDDKFSSQMNINISLESQLWHLANAELRQIFEFERNEGSESMNVTHPLMDISVTANWTKKSNLIHYKKAIFKSKITDFIPSFEIEFQKYKDIPNKLILNILKEVPTVHNINQFDKNEL